MARDTSKSSDAAAGTLWGMAQVVADACNTSAQETGGLIGTAFVVRDMMRIVDALGEDGMLRYWGELMLRGHERVTGSGLITYQGIALRFLVRLCLGRYGGCNVP